LLHSNGCGAEPDLLARVRVSRKGAGRIESGHPWIYSSDVLDRGDAVAGDAVTVVDPAGKLLGTFHYSSTSQITLRQLLPGQQDISAEFYSGRIADAIAFRSRVVENSDAFRLVHSEADRLPGLIVDNYAGYLTIQTLTQAMDKATPEIVSALRTLVNPEAIIARNDAAVRERESLRREISVLHGAAPEGGVRIRMNGLGWLVDPVGGQKTGIYLDQRENYLAAARWAHGPALDCFTSTGGFALHLAPKCESVEAVDSSATALAAAKANAEMNGIANIRWREADAFDVLSSHAQSGRRFGTVVLDPPAFAKTRAAVEGAARGYRDINYRALRLLNKGGVLVTCSCSFHFSESMLLETVAAAALDAGKTLRVLERRIQASDHPVLLTVPETLYLKSLIVEVL
jgi:23S rRNA (cytosine1962-C5)-methyltransferase